MSHMTRLDFSEDAAHHGMLKEAAQQDGVHFSCFSHLGERDISINRYILGYLVVVEKVERLQISELQVSLCKHVVS